MMFVLIIALASALCGFVVGVCFGREDDFDERKF